MLGNRIKEYLDSKGIRYSYLSERTGIPANILSPMLNGKREIKALEYFSICSALDKGKVQVKPISRKKKKRQRRVVRRKNSDKTRSDCL